MAQNLEETLKTLAQFFALLVMATTLACAHSHMERIDEAYTATDPGFHKTFTKQKSECISASVKALQEMGAGVEDQKEDEIISNRYDAFQFAKSSGDAYGATATLNKQQAKIYVRVSSEGDGCKVNIARVRAWNNGEEFQQIDVDFTKHVVANPFFGELSERLSR
jgi:hypothetical protein